MKNLVYDSDVLSHTDFHDTGSIVFFDALGLFMIHYPEWVGIIINLAVVAISLYTTYTKTRSSFQYGVSSGVYIQQLGYSFLIQVAGAVASYMSGMVTDTVLLRFFYNPWMKPNNARFAAYHFPSKNARIDDK